METGQIIDVVITGISNNPISAQTARSLIDLKVIDTFAMPMIFSPNIGQSITPAVLPSMGAAQIDGSQFF